LNRIGQKITFVPSQEEFFIVTRLLPLEVSNEHAALIVWYCVSLGTEMRKGGHERAGKGR
jgi:hypothetical protein